MSTAIKCYIIIDRHWQGLFDAKRPLLLPPPLINVKPKFRDIGRWWAEHLHSPLTEPAGGCWGGDLQFIEIVQLRGCVWEMIGKRGAVELADTDSLMSSTLAWLLTTRYSAAPTTVFNQVSISNLRPAPIQPSLCVSWKQKKNTHTFSDENQWSKEVNKRSHTSQTGVCFTKCHICIYRKKMWRRCPTISSSHNCFLQPLETWFKMWL